MFALVLNKSGVKPPALIVITALGIIAGARLVLDGRAGATEVAGTFRAGAGAVELSTCGSLQPHVINRKITTPGRSVPTGRRVVTISSMLILNSI
jgi:hypothetical protein